MTKYEEGIRTRSAQVMSLLSFKSLVDRNISVYYYSNLRALVHSMKPVSVLSIGLYNLLLMPLRIRER